MTRHQNLAIGLQCDTTAHSPRWIWIELCDDTAIGTKAGVENTNGGVAGQFEVVVAPRHQNLIIGLQCEVVGPLNCRSELAIGAEACVQATVGVIAEQL